MPQEDGKRQLVASISDLAFAAFNQRNVRQIDCSSAISDTTLADAGAWEAVVTQFVTDQRHSGLLPWLHLPAPTELVIDTLPHDFMFNVAIAGSATAHLRAAIQLVLEVMLTQAKHAVTKKHGNTCYKHVQDAFIEQDQQPECLSDVDTVLCCMLAVQCITAILMDADKKYIDTISLVYADVYGLFTKRLMTLPAIETEESMSRTTISSDLLAASVQQATAHLRNSITLCSFSVMCCTDVLVQLATFNNTAEAVATRFIEQGGPPSMCLCDKHAESTLQCQRFLPVHQEHVCLLYCNTRMHINVIVSAINLLVQCRRYGSAGSWFVSRVLHS